MAVINPDGLFYGDRLKECSDLAHLYWPFFYHASNGYGRLEISYDNFCDTALRNFKQKLTKQEFISIIQEYQANHLLFLYRVGASLWGQWIGCEDNLPRYKTAADRRSPEPPNLALQAFKNEYSKQKSDAQIFEVFVNVAECSTEVRNISESLETVRNVSHGVGVGVGAGVGIGVGEEQGKAERVSLSLEVEDHDDQLCAIAYEHPRCAHLAKHHKPLPANLERAIWEAIVRDGRELVLAGTLNLRDAVAKWPPGNDKFVPNPVKFYSDYEYLKDPKEWDRTMTDSQPQRGECAKHKGMGVTDHGSCAGCYYGWEK